MRRMWIQVGLVAVGLFVVLGHLVGLAFLGMTTSNWLGGTVVGLVLAVFGGAHLLLLRSGADTAISRRTQVLFGLAALGLGIVEGLVAAQMSDVGWWLAVPWALTALAIGVLAIDGLTGFLVALGWALLGAAGAVGVGATAHQVISRVHA